MEFMEFAVKADGLGVVEFLLGDEVDGIESTTGGVDTTSALGVHLIGHGDDALLKEGAALADGEDALGFGSEGVLGAIITDADAFAGTIVEVGALGFSELEWGHGWSLG
jgi:hypothetical protein